MKDIDKLLNEIKDEKDESQKKDKIKKLLTETDFILTKTALYPFEDEASKKESNYLKKFLEYKIDINPLFKGMDCDANLYNMILYCQLNEKLKIENIKNQDGLKEKYEISNELGCFRGDTLTSAIFLLNRYCAFLKKEIKKDKEEKYKTLRYKNFDKLFLEPTNRNKSKFSSDFKGYKKGNFEEFCHFDKHFEIIWDVLSEPVKDFLRVYQMFGNYMCIPGQSYDVEYKCGNKYYPSFNTLRSNGGKWDTIDKLLSGVYGYYKFNNKKYIKNLFTDSNKKYEVVKDTLHWLNSYGIGEEGWKKFVDINCLEGFLNKDLRPISMKTGEIIKDDELLEYNPQPDSLEEFNTFFEQLSKRIVWRTIDIYKKVRK